MPPGNADTAPALSPRERDCLLALARGQRLQAVAEDLGLSVKTVDNHIAAAKRRLGAATREQAVAIAIARGLLL